MDIEQRRLKKIVKKSLKPLGIPLNEAAFAIIECRLGNQPVKELPCHASISATLRYAHANDDAKRRVVGKLNGAGNEVVAVVPRRRKIAVQCRHIDQNPLKSCVLRTERWLSGRKQRFAKQSYGQKLYREFESLPLRHVFQGPAITTIQTRSGASHANLETRMFTALRRTAQKLTPKAGGAAPEPTIASRRLLRSRTLTRVRAPGSRRRLVLYPSIVLPPP